MLDAKEKILMSSLEKLDLLESFHFFRCFGECFALDTSNVKLYNLDFDTWQLLCSYRLGSVSLQKLLQIPEKFIEKITCSEIQARQTLPRVPTDRYTICFILTHDCNLNCIYCFDKQQRDNNFSVNLSFDNAQKAIQDVMSKFKKITLWFFGGEPLMQFSLIKQIVEFCEKIKEKQNEYDIRYTITTNGTLINTYIMEFFSKYKFSMLISHDGNFEILERQRPYADTRSLSPAGLDIHQGLKTAVIFNERLSALAVRATITGKSLRHLKTIFFDFRRMGIEKIFLCPVCSTDRDFLFTEADSFAWQIQFSQIVSDILKGDRVADIKALPQVFDYLFNLEYRLHSGERVCGMGEWACTVDVDGKRYACHRFVGRSGFELMNNSARYRNQILKLEVLEEPDHPCSSCWAKNLCGSALCPHMNEVWTGSLMVPYIHICNVQRRIIELACWAYFVLSVSGRKKYLFNDFENV